MIKKMRKNKKGFTLIELIVVIAIIAILAAVAIPNYIAVQKKAETAAALGNAQVIANAINAHNVLVGSADSSFIDAIGEVTYATLTGATFSVPITMNSTDFTTAVAYVNISADGNATLDEVS